MVQEAGGERAAGPKVRRRRRPRTLVWVALVLVVLGVWAAYAGVQLLQARKDAQAGIDQLERLRSTMSPDTLLEGDDLGTLRTAKARFDAANGHATNPALAPMRLLPFVGRQVRSVDKLTGAASDVSDIAVRRITAARSVVDTTSVATAQRVALVSQMAQIASDADGDLADVDLGPSRGLVGPLDRAHRRFATELDALRGSAHNITLASAGIEQLLRGPGRYLVFAANNSEMRIGSGAFLSVGVLTTRDGQLDLGEIKSTTTYPVPAGAVPLTGDLADNWGWLQPNAEWRNLASSPRFDANAALARQMWQAATGDTVDGVIALDIPALRSLLVATGPVDVAGQTVTPNNVLKYLMLDQYEGTDGVPQSGRREHLSDVAQAVVDRIEDGSWDVTTLVAQLADAVEGRHLMLWSNDATQQAGWEAVRAGGIVEGDSLLIGLHNRGGNKLDQFVDVDAAVSTRPVSNGTAVELRVHLTNTAPTGLPQYVAGPFEQAVGAAEGKYQGLLVCNLPPWARDAEISGIGERVASGPDGDSQVVAAYTELERGQSADATIRFVLPFGADTLRIEPSARAPGVTWSHGVQQWDDHESREILVTRDHVP